MSSFPPQKRENIPHQQMKPDKILAELLANIH